MDANPYHSAGDGIMCDIFSNRQNACPHTNVYNLTQKSKLNTAVDRNLWMTDNMSYMVFFKGTRQITVRFVSVHWKLLLCFDNW